ncbi:23S rRNA (adenine(1618)-N(6))-methyltransferase RlmF [Aureivirga sp. CE67]|uniref:23S rRNA (adenine(1618)-N(6))-methyltransferase RlmF n=1 Tax=Aureivirga sp. CE67 TaxID=1788983 RepID=UPI0018C946A9|nr:23S rRNA (adenine(1618)-N(6))-methyltransferase RlmF [Aureivirga sp. CE67]
MTKQKKNKGLHPNNLHKDGYDFELLMEKNEDIKSFVKPNKFGNLSIDFSDSKAVFEFNKALLKTYYQISFYTIPKENLCPPIPGRVDYIHHLKDLLSSLKKEEITGLDIGTGANCIYPILGSSVYNWKFIATDISKKSLYNAEKIVKRNTSLKKNIKFRLQKDSNAIFNNIIKKEDYFDFTMCNPPFHDSQEAALAGTQRKWKNLKEEKNNSNLNFGGIDNELWYEGGEKSFLHKMIKESTFYKKQVGWFTTLVSKKENVKSMKKSLEKFGAKEFKIIEMQQGNKITRVVAWRF